MTPEEKQLLLKDLCARLPYHTIVEYHGANVDLTVYARSVKIMECKPYLRLMSSMTEEEKQKYYDLTHQEEDDVWAKCLFDKMVDFCNERHLDYRGLIEKGLAFEAPKDMYKVE